MRALVFNPSFIGDAVLTTPLVNAVLNMEGKPETFFCVRPESAPLFKNLPFNILPFDKRGEYAGACGLFRFAAKVKNLKFDMALSPHRSLRSALTLKLAKIPIRVGFKEAAGAFLYTKTVKREMGVNEIRRNLNLLSMDAVGAPMTFLDVEYRDRALREIKARFGESPLVALNAGSVWPTKRWPEEHFARLANILNGKGCAVALVGGPDDLEVNTRVKKLLDFDYLDFVNKVEFSRIPALLSLAALLISNDSAPVHIAESVGTKALALFGPTLPSYGFAPHLEESETAGVAGLSCRPCSKHGGRTCPKGHFKCMRELSVETVFDVAKRMLKIV